MKNYFDLSTDEGLRNVKEVLSVLNPVTPYVNIFNIVKDLIDKTLNADERNAKQLEAAEAIIRKMKDLDVPEVSLEVNDTVGISLETKLKNFPTSTTFGSHGKIIITVKYK